MPGWFITFGRYAGGVLVFSMVALCSAVALVPCYFIYSAVDGRLGAPWALLSCPFLYGVWGWTYCLGCVLYKRAIFYRAREGEWTLFSWPVVGWGTTGALTNFANEMFLKHWKGTPFLNLYLRMMGAKIGHRVSINTVLIFDWDLLTIDDDVILGGDCVVQAHVVEGGTMRMMPVRIHKHALVGSGSKVLPGCIIEERGVLGAQSMMKKGDTIPANTVYGGVPAKLLKMRSAPGQAKAS